MHKAELVIIGTTEVMINSTACTRIFIDVAPENNMLSDKDILSKIFTDDNIGTKFLAEKYTRSSKQKWLASCAHLKGEIWIDDGAKDAMLNKGKSLLPVGIKKGLGNFEIGDAVCIMDSSNKKIAQGIVLYSSKEIKKIQGKSSKQIQEILGYKDYDEVVHRDNMVVLV